MFLYTTQPCDLLERCKPDCSDTIILIETTCITDAQQSEVTG
jgi:hypothetical protein